MNWNTSKNNRTPITTLLDGSGYGEDGFCGGLEVGLANMISIQQACERFNLLLVKNIGETQERKIFK